MSDKARNGRRPVFWVAGCRTPFLRAGTGFKELSSYDLARHAIQGLLKKSGLSPSAIERVAMGTVISSLRTSNVAREAALAAGIPVSAPAHTVAQACISANQAITSAADQIAFGNVETALAGGTESMSDIPITYRKRFRRKLLESQRYRSAWDYLNFLKGLGPSDFLPEVPSISEFSTGRTMGEDCERLAARYGASRSEQDAYAVRSHHLAAKAAEEGLLDDEIENVAVPPAFERIGKDNGIRGDTSAEQLAKLKAAFVKPYGSLTAGNSSFLTDGGAAVLLMSEEAARHHDLEPKIVLRDYVYTAQDPQDALLLGPAYATPKLLDRNGLTLDDIDVFEFHEAFAGQIVANLKCLDSVQFAKEHLGRDDKVGEIPMDKFNTLGGSLSLGHPFGATGARLVTTAANRLLREDGELALIAACAAGGLGSAILLQRV